MCVMWCKDIAADALMAGLATAKDVPYFDGDFWPNTLEEAIAEEEKEKNIEESIDSSGAAELEVRCRNRKLKIFHHVFRGILCRATW